MMSCYRPIVASNSMEGIRFLKQTFNRWVEIGLRVEQKKK